MCIVYSWQLLLTPTKNIELPFRKQEYCAFKLHKETYKQTQFHNLKPQSVNGK